ncbi:MAG: hypothetical protein E6Q88_08060 [Lysobacteraceae bacterium]|nr:MAG: hypothetical protein E6Q88_08060 [Xanthomonadaceae bacterium]
MTANEPLSPEERDLAERLKRLGGPREPAPALDARILAAARAAVSETAPVPIQHPADAGIDPAADVGVGPATDPNVVPLRPRAKTQRWPLGFGLAASLVLAAGIGWRLHGDGDGSLKATEDAAPATSFESAEFESAEHVTEAVILPPELQREPPPLPPQETEAEMPRMRAPASPGQKPAAPPPGFAADMPARASEPVAADAAAEGAADTRNLAASEADAFADAAASEDKTLDSVVVTGARASAERSVGAAEYTRTPLNERREQMANVPAASAPSGQAGARTAAKTTTARTVPAAAPAAPPPATRQNAVARDEEVKRRADLVGGAIEQRKSESAKDDSASSGAHAFGAPDFDDRPPASADSPQVRQAWLQRIRDLLARGETAAAAKSLQEFRRRYPQAELPEDLRKLASTLPPPTP